MLHCFLGSCSFWGSHLTPVNASSLPQVNSSQSSVYPLTLGCELETERGYVWSHPLWLLCCHITPHFCPKYKWLCYGPPWCNKFCHFLHLPGEILSTETNMINELDLCYLDSWSYSNTCGKRPLPYLYWGKLRALSGNLSGLDLVLHSQSSHPSIVKLWLTGA